VTPPPEAADCEAAPDSLRSAEAAPQAAAAASVTPPWWAALSAAGLSESPVHIHRRAFDFSTFASAAPPSSHGGASSAAPTAKEAAALSSASDEDLQRCVRDAQSAAEAHAEAEVASLTKLLEALEVQRKELEVEVRRPQSPGVLRRLTRRSPQLAAAKREAECASASDGDAVVAETWRLRVRRLQAALEANGGAKCSVTCRQIFKAADG
jgi:hypothetical protein